LKGTIRFSAGLGGDALFLLEQAKKFGFEGLIGKKLHSRYEAGSRSGAWIKLKLLKEQEFIIGGYTNPKGSRPFFGSLLVGYYDNKKFIYSGRVGTGFNRSTLSALYSQLQSIAQKKCPFTNLVSFRNTLNLSKKEWESCHWVKPLKVCQIKFSEWTYDKHLRQPVFLGLREDKEASEVIIST
jgi:bifunctional non-homologous end joining protein LigD